MTNQENKWKIGTTDEELPLIIRSLSSKPDQSHMAEYNQLIVIKWPYSSTERGMPDNFTQKQMDIFEDRLGFALSQKKAGVLAVTITGKSLKEWRYYISDPQEFMFFLNEISDPDSPYPIELEKFNDSSWEALAEFL